MTVASVRLAGMQPCIRMRVLGHYTDTHVSMLVCLLLIVHLTRTCKLITLHNTIPHEFYVILFTISIDF